MGKGLDVDVSGIEDADLAEKIKSKENVLLIAILRTIDVIATVEEIEGVKYICLTEKANDEVLYHIPAEVFELDDDEFKTKLIQDCNPKT